MSKFHFLNVKDIVRETADAVSVELNIPESLKQEYNFKQGQYLTFKFLLNGQEHRRSYSICSSPFENKLKVAVKKVTNGLVSTHINNSLKIGDTVEVMVPMGNFFTETNVNNKKNYVLFAGGSGITPMLSILKTVLATEPQSSITLFYGNNDENSIIFKNELNTLVIENSQRLKIYHILNSSSSTTPEIFKGIMTQDKCSQLISQFTTIDSNIEVFICGPGPMMENAAAALKAFNLSEDKIHIEYFSSPTTSQPTTTVTAEPNQNNILATIILDKETHRIELKNNETILEGALRIGLDPPYACQGGSCCTCRALLEEGEVKMAVNYGLSSSEIKKKYILTCQSKPTTNSVVVNYDKG